MGGGGEEGWRWEGEEGGRWEEEEFFEEVGWEGGGEGGEVVMRGEGVRKGEERVGGGGILLLTTLTMNV